MTSETRMKAIYILESICFELELAEGASDPYPLDDAYLNWMLEDTCNLIYRGDNGGEYAPPSDYQALLIVTKLDRGES